MKRYAWVGVALVGTCLLGGCVERRYIVRSNPSGALLYVNGHYMGPTPQDGYIVYYGKYNFQLAKDGYETLRVIQRYPAPWYEYPGLDFIAENIFPFKIRDVRIFEFTLQPEQTVSHLDVLQRGTDLRTRSRGIGTAPVTPPAAQETAPNPRLEPQPPPGPPPGAIPAPPPPPGTVVVPAITVPAGPAPAQPTSSPGTGTMQLIK
jgi:hypothetical protein